MIWVYNFLLTIFAPLWVPWMLWRSRRRNEAVDWSERAGNLVSQLKRDEPRLWVHAVSVGEVIAALPILRAVRTLRPDVQILLTTTTSSGQRTAREQAIEWVDQVAYFPIDVVRFQLSALTRVRPHVVAVMETELWMNFLWAAKVVDATTLLVNGRISDRSFRRSRYLTWFYRALLRNLDRALMQTEQDAERLRVLGGLHVEVLGNAKFDQAAEVENLSTAEARLRLGIPTDVPVLVVGSTRGEDEESLVLDAITRAGIDNLWVVFAPRHQERTDPLSHELGRRGLGVPARRSRSESGPWLLLDTYGELSWVYAAADVVVVGGGFGDYGGQNLIQPLAQGKPVVHGPHMQNFAEATRSALAAGATREAATAEDLAVELRRLFSDPRLREPMGAAAVALVNSARGASERYAQAIVDALPPKGTAKW